MNVMTNNNDCYVLIPECKTTGVQEWGSQNGYEYLTTDQDLKIKTFIPYREPYGRIVRAVAADLHEILLDNNISNLNENSWSVEKPKIISYFTSILTDDFMLPFDKDFKHTAPLVSYLVDTLDNFEFVDVDKLDVPGLPENFYEQTVPYWEIENIYNTNVNFKNAVDKWIAQDQLLLQGWIDAQ